MIEICFLCDLLCLLFIYQCEFKLVVFSVVVIIVFGVFLLLVKYEFNVCLLVKLGCDLILLIEISNCQVLVMLSIQCDFIVDEECLFIGWLIVCQVVECYFEVLVNWLLLEGLWKCIKFYVKKVIGVVFDGICVILEIFGVIEEIIVVECLVKDFEKKFEVIYVVGLMVMEISFIWSELEVVQEVVKVWIEIYMEECIQVFGCKSLYVFYEVQIVDSVVQIKSYKVQIFKYFNEIGVFSIEDCLQDLFEWINVLCGECFNLICLIVFFDSVLEFICQ